MEQTTFVKLDRCFDLWRFRDNPIVVTVFLKLLTSANITPRYFNETLIDRGECVITSHHTCEQLGITRSQLRTALKKMENAGTVRLTAHSRFTVVRLLNFNKYQAQYTQNAPQSAPQGETPQSLDTQGLTASLSPTDRHEIAMKSPRDRHEIATLKERENERIKEYKNERVSEEKEIRTHTHTQNRECINSLSASSVSAPLNPLSSAPCAERLNPLSSASGTHSLNPLSNTPYTDSLNPLSNAPYTDSLNPLSKTAFISVHTPKTNKIYSGTPRSETDANYNSTPVSKAEPNSGGTPLYATNENHSAAPLSVSAHTHQTDSNYSATPFSVSAHTLQTNKNYGAAPLSVSAHTHQTDKNYSATPLSATDVNYNSTPVSEAEPCFGAAPLCVSPSANSEVAAYNTPPQDGVIPYSGSAQKRRFGEFNNVLLSEGELERLKSRYPAYYKAEIERLSSYIARSGKRYLSHYAVLLQWIPQDMEKYISQPYSFSPQGFQGTPSQKKEERSPASYDIERAEMRSNTIIPKFKKRIC